MADVRESTPFVLFLWMSYLFKKQVKKSSKGSSWKQKTKHKLQQFLLASSPKKFRWLCWNTGVGTSETRKMANRQEWTEEACCVEGLVCRAGVCSRASPLGYATWPGSLNPSANPRAGWRLSHRGRAGPQRVPRRNGEFYDPKYQLPLADLTKE